MAKQRTEKIIACIFWVIGAALIITAMLTDYWISATDQIKFGLFEYCLVDRCAKFGKLKRYNGIIGLINVEMLLPYFATKRSHGSYMLQ